ncbi:tRNA pseudouridine(55) synthase TruB [Winogradskyella aurantiaca]|uniref:tRNA pseudouridine(55) synthase TruB n=1 Tax=Winogradskyella aurantiaca TaxID=2219558 RepID=UPI000E1D71E6|nr:tRNA pseudouridine(55) synthase TruB [Winogradskyella aurantiaca]
MVSVEDYLKGQVILIDKPLEWTSFQVVNKLRWAIRKTFNLKKIKVGHAGTLDPLATGLLIICTGKKTKEISIYQGQEKEYTGTIRLGATTPSYDLETEIDAEFETDHITTEAIHEATKRFLGVIEQYPPIFSAVKKDGKRLYEFARANESVEIKPRQIEISSFEITEINGLDINFRVRCSKGTYIRSLAHDFGNALKSGAHLTALRRTAIGDFKIEDAQTLDGFLSSLEQ